MIQQRTKLHAAAFALLAMAALAAAPAAAQEPDARSLNAETFDEVWAIIRDTHWDPAMNGADWEAARVELRPKAEAAADTDALRSVLRQLIARLKQSHFAILPGNQVLEDAPAAAAPAAVPASAAPPAAASPAVRKVPRRTAQAGLSGASVSLLPDPSNPAVFETVVTRVRAGSGAERAGIVPGTVVRSINDRAVTRDLPPGDGPQRYERGAIVRARITGKPGTTGSWNVRMPDGTERVLDVELAEDTRPRVVFGGLPPQPVSLEAGMVPERDLGAFGAAGARIGLIRFDSWFVPIAEPFHRAVDAMRDADGIVIDLRCNPGGISGMVMGISGHFTAQPEPLGSMTTRDGTLNFISNPRTVSTEGAPVRVYDGPVAILVDDGTASTSEIFAGGMQYAQRARIFGMRTAGAALPSTFDQLANGDVLLHAIADYRLPDGRPLEASGVRPDMERAYTRVDYARDGDPVLADAVRWIAQQRAHTPQHEHKENPQ